MFYPHLCAFAVCFMFGVIVSGCYYLFDDEQSEREEQNEKADNELAVDSFILYLLLGNCFLLLLMHCRGQG
jgi:hypothetical protein